MKRLFVICAAAAAMFAVFASTVVHAADVDEIIKKLEESGVLDKAVERAIDRFVTRQQEEQRKAQENAEAQRAESAKHARKPDAARDHILGAPNAEVSIIEYSDFECPYCKSFHATPQDVVKRMAGKVNLIWRHFPLEFHNPVAFVESEAAICAGRVGGNQAFWRYADAVMQRTASSGKGMPVSGGANPLIALASTLKLDAAAFAKCMESGIARTQITDDQKDGVGAGITGTPGVILRNNRTGKTLAFAGALPTEVLEAQVKSLLAAQ